jgi:hypothetical protein
MIVDHGKKKKDYVMMKVNRKENIQHQKTRISTKVPKFRTDWSTPTGEVLFIRSEIATISKGNNQ